MKNSTSNFTVGEIMTFCDILLKFANGPTVQVRMKIMVLMVLEV